MRNRTMILGLPVALALCAGPAAAGSQSSNSSSNCSNGHCVRIESYHGGDERWGWGWMREEVWREGPGWRPRARPGVGRGWHEPGPRWMHGQRGRGRDKDDD